MAYNASNEIQKVILEEDKNDRGDKVRVTLVTRKDNNSKAIDLRNFYTNDMGDVKPTQKGIRISDEMLYTIVKEMALQLADDEKVKLIEELKK